MIDWKTTFLLIIVVLIVYVFLLLLMDAYNLRRLRKKYKEEQDASREGERRRKNGEVDKFRAREFTAEKQNSFKRQELFQGTVDSSTRQTSNSFGESSGINREPSKADQLLSKLFGKE